MKRVTRVVPWTLLLLIAFGLLVGCSGEGDEKGVVEKASDEVAAKAVEQINKPLDKAKEAQALQNAESQKLQDIINQTDE